MIVYQIESD